MAFGLSQTQTKNSMLQSISDRVGDLEENFSSFSNSMKASMGGMGEKIDDGNDALEKKIDAIFKIIGKNNQDIAQIKTGQKVRAAALKWFFSALKQSLSIVISIVTLYFVFRYGGKGL